MAFIDCHFYSESLRISTSMYVILPQSTHSQIGLVNRAGGTKHPTLYLLHGLSDDHTIWMRRTSIERYAAQLGIAVVMPAVNRSYYTNMANGYNYWSFISEELPALARSFFPLSDQKEDNFVAGLSMGGYGAFKLALNFPNKFAAAASLSGPMDVSDNQINGLGEEFQQVFGDRSTIHGSTNDLFHLADKVSQTNIAAPLLYQYCGTEDYTYESNTRFRDHCIKLGLDLTYEEEPGTHEWGYWDRKIQTVLEWLPLRQEKLRN